MKRFLATCLLPVVVGCATQVSHAGDSLVPGTIGVTVGPDRAGVIITAVRPGSPAARADLRVGDIITRYDGSEILNEREFERRLLSSRPGSRAHLEVMRAGALRSMDVPVEELATAPPV